MNVENNICFNAQMKSKKNNIINSPSLWGHNRLQYLYVQWLDSNCLVVDALREKVTEVCSSRLCILADRIWKIEFASMGLHMNRIWSQHLFLGSVPLHIA